MNRLSTDESLRLARVDTVTLQCAEVFGSADLAQAWLCRPNHALDARSPLSLLDTADGANGSNKFSGGWSMGSSPEKS